MLGYGVGVDLLFPSTHYLKLLKTISLNLLYFVGVSTTEVLENNVWRFGPKLLYQTHDASLGSIL